MGYGYSGVIPEAPRGRWGGLAQQVHWDIFSFSVFQFLGFIRYGPESNSNFGVCLLLQVPSSLSGKRERSPPHYLAAFFYSTKTIPGRGGSINKWGGTKIPKIAKVKDSGERLCQGIYLWQGAWLTQGSPRTWGESLGTHGYLIRG